MGIRGNAMAGDSGSSFPYTALSVVALFLSTAYLTQHGFDAWRPSEPDAAKRLQLAYPPVEARLWEDPLGALDRHRQRLEACPKEDKSADAGTGKGGQAEASGRVSDAACQTGQPINGRRFRDMIGDGSNVTLIAAMLPGTVLVGADENRRRARYAVLAGLNVAGFAPDDGERMGLLRVQRCESLAGCAPDELTPMELVYETLNGPNRRRAVVLWIDDTAIGQRWLTATTMMFAELTRPTKKKATAANPTLRIVGPSSSNLLVRALQADLPQLRDRPDAPDFNTNFEMLKKVRLISPLSTASPAQVLSEAGVSGSCTGIGDAHCVDRSIKELIEGAVPSPKTRFAQKSPPFFVSTIGTDDLLIKRLAEELVGRDLCQGGEKRVILISEWDSIYARAFSKTLQDRLQCPRGSAVVEEQSYSYLRGLDGAIASSSAKQDNGRSSDGKAPVEWPEGRSQADYVRRLVEQIVKANTKRPVYAVGMIGSDVHDKLVLVQALRDAFPDRILFTTDIDARLLHPRVTKYTRNLVVAATLPLEWDEAAGLPEADPAKSTAFGPFRDSYQTATFLAARIAVETAKVTDCSDSKQQGELECRVRTVVAAPSLFEIGRSGMIPLPAAGVDPSEAHKRFLASMLALTVFLALIGLLLVGYPRHAMRNTWQWCSDNAQPYPASSAVVAGLEVAAMAFAVGVVAEMAMHTNGGAWVPGLSSAVAVALFLAGVYILRPRVGRTVGGGFSTGLAAKIYVIAAVAIVPLVIELVAGLAATTDIREPFALLSGVSAWPSQILRVLVIVLFTWFLDETWCESNRAVNKIYDTYRLSSVSHHAPNKVAKWHEIIWRSVTVWFYWKPDVVLPGERVDGARLWREYSQLMENPARVPRVAIWTGLTIGVACAATLVINHFLDESLPEVPARGLMDRDLFRYTVLASAGAVIILLVTVADLTILTTRFVGMLKHGRTVYPPRTIAHFAAELGPQLEAVARLRVAALPGERSDDHRPRDRNSLLDDWIDARLLAEHTEAVGRFIIFPFILLGLLVVARSPLFDNWYMGGAVLAGLVVYAVWSITMATVLNYDAERQRRKALAGMEADRRWLSGASPPFDKLSGVYGDLIDQVRGLRQGAFAPFFEKPIVQAILVPLGGAGGVQLVQLLMYARTP